MDGPAARCLARVHHSGTVICDDHEVGYVIYLQYGGTLVRTMTFPDEPVSQTEVAALPFGRQDVLAAL